MGKGPHNHNQAEIPRGRRLILTMILNLIIPLVEIYAGIMAGSMALISDALHNLSDLTSLMISYAALKIGGRGLSLNQTFGYRRVEVMAAVFNVALLFGAAFYIAAAGWGRLKNPLPILGGRRLFPADPAQRVVKSSPIIRILTMLPEYSAEKPLGPVMNCS